MRLQQVPNSFQSRFVELAGARQVPPGAARWQVAVLCASKLRKCIKIGPLKSIGYKKPCSTRVKLDRDRIGTTWGPVNDITGVVFILGWSSTRVIYEG